MQLPVVDPLHHAFDTGGSLVEGETDPRDVIRWALRRFSGWRIVATTGFGMEGCALIDMLATAYSSMDVLYLDTHFLFEETHELKERLRRRYPRLHFINVGTSYTPEQQEADHGPELWKRDPDLCCRLRKVEPMAEALRGVDVWLTAIRRDQSPTRANTPFVQWDQRNELVKVSPLAYWSRGQVWAYVKQNDVPYNPLHEEGYPTIGCTHCTSPVQGATAETYSRAGRWQGLGKTECGLHIGENI